MMTRSNGNVARDVHHLLRDLVLRPIAGAVVANGGKLDGIRPVGQLTGLRAQHWGHRPAASTATSTKSIGPTRSRLIPTTSLTRSYATETSGLRRRAAGGQTSVLSWKHEQNLRSVVELGLAGSMAMASLMLGLLFEIGACDAPTMRTPRPPRRR